MLSLCWYLTTLRQAERENEALVQAQGQKEEDALAAAVQSFDQEFKADLDAVKAGGGPYKVSCLAVAVSDRVEKKRKGMRVEALLSLVIRATEVAPNYSPARWVGLKE